MRCPLPQQYSIRNHSGIYFKTSYSACSILLIAVLILLQFAVVYLVISMPPKKRQVRAPAHEEQQIPCVGEIASSTREDALPDESSDSECEYDDASRQIGRDAARGTLGARSREHYTKYQEAMVSWAQKQNAVLPAEKRFKTQVPFSYRYVATYLDHLKQKLVPWPHQAGLTKHYSTGLMNAVIISIKDAYRIEEVAVQDEIDTLMSNFYKMYCKFIGHEKLLGRYPVKVGRSAIPIAAFKLISKKLFEMQNDGNWKPQIQIWPYWNILGTLLSRSERVGHALIEHIGMKEDMILFDTQTSKSDPSGKGSYAKCIASNPYDPHSDVFLGLAFLFFCRDSSSDNHIFSYADMPATATMYLRKALDSFTESEEIVLGCSKNLVGLHTAKKTGCSKLYDNECTVAVAVEKRCDHNLHGSQTCYIGDLPSNDAFNARILAGLPFGTDEFSAKPCHFDGIPSDLLCSIPWSSLIKGYHTFPAACKAIMPFLLATVIHHEKFIRINLRGGGGHPILFSPLFTIHKYLFDMLSPYVKHGICQSDLTTTGVPLSSKTHAAVRRIENRITHIEGALQRLGVLPADFHVLPCDTAGPSSTRQCDVLADKIDQLLPVLESLAGISSSTGGQRLLSKATAQWSIGYLPTDFRIPTMAVDELWRAWHLASPATPAFKGICGKMLPASDHRINDIRQLSRYSKVIEFITGQTKVSGDNVEAFFDALWKQCFELALEENVALGTVNQGAGTFYNKVCAHKNLKAALTSSTRVVINIHAKDATPDLSNVGLVCADARSLQRPVPSISQGTPSMAPDVNAQRLRQSLVPLILPRFNIPSMWNAWWCASESFTLPLRRLEQDGMWRRTYTAKPSEITRLCRYKKAVRHIQSNMSDEMCEVATDRCFLTGWGKLSAYLMQEHGICIMDNAAPSVLYECCNKLGKAFKPPVWSTYQ
jgi:hypothetical protein